MRRIVLWCGIGLFLATGTSSAEVARGSESDPTPKDCLVATKDDQSLVAKLCQISKFYYEKNLKLNRGNIELQSEIDNLREDGKSCRNAIDTYKAELASYKVRSSEQNHLISQNNELVRRETLRNEDLSEMKKQILVNKRLIENFQQANIVFVQAFSEIDRVIEARCAPQATPLSRISAPSDLSCPECGALVWLSRKPSPDRDGTGECMERRIGIAEALVSMSQLMKCEHALECMHDNGRNHVKDEDPARYVQWMDAQRYLAWLNRDLLPLGYRARLPHASELQAIAETFSRRKTGETDVAPTLPATLHWEWTQGCADWRPNHGCLVRQVHEVMVAGKANSGGPPKTDRRNLQEAHGDTGFRIVVEALPPAMRPKERN